MVTRVIVPPAIEPVSLNEAKNYLRVEHQDDDPLIAMMIAAARELVENFLRRALINTTYRDYYDNWPGTTIYPARAPLQSASIAYDPVGSGPEVTLPTTYYHLDVASEPGRIILASGAQWPSLRSAPHALRITYVAGYGATTGSVPGAIRSAIMALTSHMYEERRIVVVGNIVESLPYGVDQLLWPYRLMEF